MIFKGKPVKVIIGGDAKEEYAELNEIVGQEITKHISGTDHQTLFNSIKQKIDLLKVNPEYGRHIPKNQIPKDYIRDFEVNNLWKVNLAGAWRMIYTLRGSDIEIIALILDIFDHKKYDKKFGYKKS